MNFSFLQTKQLWMENLRPIFHFSIPSHPAMNGFDVLHRRLKSPNRLETKSDGYKLIKPFLLQPWNYCLENGSGNGKGERGEGKVLRAEAEGIRDFRSRESSVQPRSVHDAPKLLALSLKNLPTPSPSLSFSWLRKWWCWWPSSWSSCIQIPPSLYFSLSRRRSISLYPCIRHSLSLFFPTRSLAGVLYFDFDLNSPCHVDIDIYLSDDWWSAGSGEANAAFIGWWNDEGERISRYMRGS